MNGMLYNVCVSYRGLLAYVVDCLGSGALAMSMDEVW